MKNKIILYDLSGKDNIRFSPPCWNVKLCLIHNNIDFDTVPIRFTEKSKISFSNQSLVPIIKYNQEIVSDSWNIFLWLNDKFKDIKLTAGFHGAISLYKQKKIPKLLKLIQFPCSDALSYAQICEGRIDVVIQCNNKIWDIHPLIPIINAAGGIVTTWDNQNAKQAGHVVVSSNKTIHKKILGLLKPVV